MARITAAALVALSLVCCRPPASPAVDAASILESNVLLVVEKANAKPDAGLGTADFDPYDGTASAFVLEDGRVMTAAHCTTETDEVTLRDHDGHVTGAVLERVDERLDLALLRPTRPLPSRLRMRLADETPKAGTEVFTFATSSLGISALARGVIAARTRGGFGEQMGPNTVTTIQAWHGMSGGPLLAMDGGPRVVGVNVDYLNINTAGGNAEDPLLGAVPIEDVHDFIAGRVASSVARYAAYARAHAGGGLDFTVTATPTKHRWFGLSLRGSLPIDGNIVMVSAYVLDGSKVVGKTAGCFKLRARASVPIDCEAEGVAWVPRAGTYDAVLVAGDTPIGHRPLEIAAN